MGLGGGGEDKGRLTFKYRKENRCFNRPADTSGL